ncbi:Hypothetical protein, putative [Bodo saltans]|uniref:tRNA (adenine(58)-N(1))-methyltransferase non-catalytic subunit TRM6 n=1 Tax=Bodo saltans TaxID=75058 RepID=A0A0S4JAT8_BODSA|nr:Hypothetical protein, putative [Bodo saltans]|eukprot:CUG87120.1 Hypothetical protein, putative [Bodo saltans]
MIAEGDTVMITGGGVYKSADVKKNATLRLGRVGTVQLMSLVGMRFGEVVQFDERTKRFVPSNEHPDLDKTTITTGTEEEKDNRNLIDTFGANQQLSHAEVMALKEERGVEGLLEQLVESSSTFASKTAFSQEKYIRKKKVKRNMFKIERVTPDNLCEMYIPTVTPSDQSPDDGGAARSLRLRCDTLALMIHHADVHSNAIVLCYEKTNGVLCASLLNRLGEHGKVLQVMDKVSHPNIVTAKVMGLSDVKQRWKAVPRNQPFLTGEDYETAEKEEAVAAPAAAAAAATEEQPTAASAVFLPLVALCGHVVVFSNFLENLTEIYSLIRNDCINIQISETWYRHHQVLSNRTHPTVNMSTAGGYLLTAVRVEKNSAPRPRYTVITDEAFAKYNTGSGKVASKRPREE